MKTSAAAWKKVDSKCHQDKLYNDGINSRQWRREVARYKRTQQTKVKTNKGFK